MTKKKCTVCNGTGYEHCEVHGRHPCENCNGSGCVGDRIVIPSPYHIPFETPDKPWRYDRVWCNTTSRAISEITTY